jgi:Styrene monooxygenase A putative substrate binding domain
MTDIDLAIGATRPASIEIHAPRTITIVGGGQAGIMLAIGLRKAGHFVCLVQDRSAAAVARGRVTSSQCLFATALAEERRLGLDLWSAQCPRIDGVRLDSAAPGSAGMPFSFIGRLRSPAQSVDQRLKFSRWLDVFEALGGALEIQHADIDSLERWARNSDLVVVATGKGPLSGLFLRDEGRSPFARPMRSLSMIYLQGADAPNGPSCISSTALPKAGGVMRFPALAGCGPCEILVFEAAIGGPLDICHGDMAADEQWAAMRAALADAMPLEAERLARARPTDEQAVLAGRITPTVRHAVGHLPSGRTVLGIGDAVVLNDPLVGQGANNAAKMARVVLDAILHRDRQPFDGPWLANVADALWRRVRAATVWTNMSLLPPQPHVVALLKRATTDQATADRFAQGFDEPETILPLLLGQEA